MGGVYIALQHFIDWEIHCNTVILLTGFRCVGAVTQVTGRATGEQVTQVNEQRYEH